MRSTLAGLAAFYDMVTDRLADPPRFRPYCRLPCRTELTAYHSRAWKPDWVRFRAYPLCRHSSKLRNSRWPEQPWRIGQSDRRIDGWFAVFSG